MKERRNFRITFRTAVAPNKLLLSTQTAPSKTSSLEPKCKDCGEALTGKKRFCSACGAKQPAPAKSSEPKTEDPAFAAYLRAKNDDNNGIDERMESTEKTAEEKNESPLKNNPPPRDKAPPDELPPPSNPLFGLKLSTKKETLPRSMPFKGIPEDKELSGPVSDILTDTVLTSPITPGNVANLIAENPDLIGRFPAGRWTRRRPSTTMLTF